MPPIRRRPQASPLAAALRWIVLIFMLLLLIAACAVVLLVNGDNIKKPLQDLLQQQTGLESRIDHAEFSPLYPNVLKVEGFRLGDLQADEIYLDVDLLSLLPKSESLHVNEFYARALRGPQQETQQLMELLAAHKKAVQIDVLRLHELPLHTDRLQAATAALRLNDVILSADQPPVTSGGSAQLQEAVIDQIPLRSLRVEFTPDGDAIVLSSLQAELLGGVVSGRGGRLEPQANALSFEQLDLSRLILKDGLNQFGPYQLTARRGRLQELFFAPAEDLALQQLSADFTDLKLQEGQLSVQLTHGTAAELALPKMELNLTELFFDGTLREPDQAAFKLSGQLLQGNFSVDFVWNRAAQSLGIHDLWLQDNKIDFKPRQLELLQEAADGLKISLDNALGENLRLLSFVEDFPLSVEALDVQASALQLQGGRLQGAAAGLINLNFRDLAYADLIFREGNILAALSDEMINVSVPRLNLQHSELSGAGALSFSRAPGFLIINAPDFDLSDLNCSLIPHLLHGRVSLNLDIRAPGPFSLEDWRQTAAALQGSFRLSGDNLLISNLGLDLINGGPRENLAYSLKVLLRDLRQADTGLYNFVLNGSFTPGRGTLRGTFDTPASHVFVNFAANLNDLTLSGQSNMVSHSGDARTRISLDGSLTDPSFTLEALERGLSRPGLQNAGEAVDQAPAAADKAVDQTAGAAENTKDDGQAAGDKVAEDKHEAESAALPRQSNPPAKSAPESKSVPASTAESEPALQSAPKTQSAPAEADEASAAAPLLQDPVPGAQDALEHN